MIVPVNCRNKNINQNGAVKKIENQKGGGQ